MEVLDQFFGNVCELDLVFNFYKVSGIEESERDGDWVLTMCTGVCDSRRSVSGGRDSRDVKTSCSHKIGAPG